MKVLFLKDVKNVCRKSDVKEVSDGYARNFLIPKGLAKIATASDIKNLEIKKLTNEKKDKEIKQKLESLAKNLADKEFIFKVKTGSKGEVFESVNKETIKNKLFEDSGEFKNHGNIEIDLSKPIKTLGEYFIEINFGKGIRGKVKIKLQPLS
ncbi:50S ribosomal protein L9 [Candidatus Wolfebacteria bacterium]|nr:50S ribosomal protein L9 [Candidatus Wolfebacteria bacterium]